ncbi:MAG: hypothetical protein JWP01_55 [Myxococcales bacterium]|nr:hypothetical protein [Myxococcales bacterium]
MYALPVILLTRLHQYAIDARRKNRTWHYFAWSGVAALIATVMFLLATTLVALLFYAKLWWLAIAMIGLLLLPIVGPTLVRHVLVPLGAYRLAYYLGWACRPGKDPTAYGLVAAAWAQAVKPIGAGEAWVALRRDKRIPLGDAEVIATALLAASRGDAATARLLMRSAHMLVEIHPMVRELAGEWLACDAAERGAWSEIAEDAEAARWPATPLTYFLEGVAARRLGSASAPSRRELWARWLLAPHRRHTNELRDAATPTSSETPAAHEAQTNSVDAPPPDRAPLPRAIAAHLAFSTSAPSLISLGTTVRAWDAALSDGATHGWLGRRALELDAPLGAVDRALREIATVVTDQLARIADGAQLGAPMSHGPIGDGLARRLRHGRLDNLEAGFTRWRDRQHDGEHHAAIDEWREFIALQTAYTAAITAGGAELRRLAFPHAYSTGTHMAAWLWNTRSEYALSHAISKWLLDEALAVGDTEAIELGHRNCDLYVPTRNDK